MTNRIFDRQLATRQGLASSILASAAERGRLAHAYLISGRALADKWLLARQLAAYLNCQMPDREANGSCLFRLSSFPAQAGAQAKGPESACTNCRWIAGDRHPQAFITLAGEETRSGKISVEKARLLSEELAKTCRFIRLVVVAEAGQDILHRPAANALLKTMEEPGAGCLFLLFAVHSEAVLPTVVSRCQVLPTVSPAAPGLWLEPGGQPCLEQPGDRLEQVEASPAGLSASEITALFEPAFSSRKALASANGVLRTLELSRRLEEMARSQLKPGLLVDLMVANEVQVLREEAARKPAVVLYLSRLLQLSEETKAQIEHFVPAKPALEAFALGWRQLIIKLSGEAYLGRL